MGICGLNVPYILLKASPYLRSLITCFSKAHLTVKCCGGNPFCEESSTKSLYKRRLYFVVNHEWQLSREIAVFTVGKLTRKLASIKGIQFVCSLA